jgi:hypothetical protein
MKRLTAVLFAGLLVISACGGDDDGDDASDDTTEETTETTDEEAALTLDEWVEEADAICEEANDAGDEVGSPASIDDVIEMAPDLYDVSEAQYDDLVALGLPDEQADDVEEALALLEEQLGILEEIVDAGDDEEAINELLEEGAALGEEADAIAADLGLEVCGAGGDVDSDTTVTTDSDTTDTTLSADAGLSELLAAGLGDLGLTSEESTCVSDGMVAEYSVTELAELDPNDPAVQSVIVEILLTCVTPERIVELDLQ